MTETPPALAEPRSGGHFKDTILDQLARDANVAQFVSFDPRLQQRFAWIRDWPVNQAFGSLREAIDYLLRHSPERSVNVRCYQPHDAKSREFLYGLRSAEEVEAQVRRLAADGLYTLINETIDIHDGGVSGVAFGTIVEFAPGDTPRCVEKPGTVSISRKMAPALFETVYGFVPALPADECLRVEFSLHPLRRGYRHDHTVFWETEHSDGPPIGNYPRWPNRFSRFLGDKAFGLLMAHLLALPVPRTQVIARGLAPFSFGSDTGSHEVWLRTCPVEQVPGRFTTTHGWIDPFRLMQQEDPDGTAIASILCQQGVEAAWSGALLSPLVGEPVIEGVAGIGEGFMTGERAPVPLPDGIYADVLQCLHNISEYIGPVRFEWVHDGNQVWIVQLHRGAMDVSGSVIYPGEAERFHTFQVSEGLEALRALVARVQGSGDGIVVQGNVGITSHLGDVLRKAQIPSRLEREVEHAS